MIKCIKNVLIAIFKSINVDEKAIPKRNCLYKMIKFIFPHARRATSFAFQSFSPKKNTDIVTQYQINVYTISFLFFHYLKRKKKKRLKRSRVRHSHDQPVETKRHQRRSVRITKVSPLRSSVTFPCCGKRRENQYYKKFTR